MSTHVMNWKGCFGSGCNSEPKQDDPYQVQQIPSIGGLSAEPAVMPYSEPQMSVNPVDSGSGCSCDSKTTASFKPGRLVAIAVLLAIGLIYNYSQR